MVASKYSLCDMENNTWNLNYVQCLSIALMEKAWFMAPVECNFNGKGIMVPMEYISMVYSLNGKGMDLWKIVFRSGNRRGKRGKKYSIKDAMSIKFANFHQVDKNNVTSSFQGFWKGLYFFANFSFHYHCQLVKSQPSHGFYGPVIYWQVALGDWLYSP